MTRATNVRERWITEVLRTDTITEGTKVLLLAMSRHMSDGGRVSRERRLLAADVGLQTPQRVTNRIKEAREAELLDVVRRGGNGQLPIYEAMLPRADQGARIGHPQGAQIEHPEGAQDGHPQGTGFGHPVSGTLRVPGSGTLNGDQGARIEHPQRAHARAGVTSGSREDQPAPAGSRGVRTDDEQLLQGEDATALLVALPELDKEVRRRLRSGERRALRWRDMPPDSRRSNLAYCPGCGAAYLVSEEECWRCGIHPSCDDLFAVVAAPPPTLSADERQAAVDQLLEEHVAQSSGPLPPAVRSATQRQVVALVSDGCDPVDVRAGLERMRAAALSLSKLPELVVEAQNRRAAADRSEASRSSWSF